HAGHYGNAISPKYVVQWAGVGTGSMHNCTNCVMVAILDQHDTFVQLPDLDSEDVEHPWAYSQAHSCPGWHKGILEADGSAVHPYAKPAMHGKTFFDCKSHYSLNFQASIHYYYFFAFSPFTKISLISHSWSYSPIIC
ncbi:hypothetical protein PAXRUDRAFT_180257, partial [Paxillus rubicundulus Ve08.2h10]